MKLTSKQLDAAVSAKIISASQAKDLYAFLQQESQHVAHFSFTHILYYLGGLLAIGAMTLFMNLGWEQFGGTGIVALCTVYALLGLQLTHSFGKKALSIPAGITATFVVCLTPLAIFGLQHALGVWPDSTEYQDMHRRVEWHWLYMELGTLAVSVIMAWRYRYPFLVMPVAVTLWYLSMDLTAMLSGGDYNWELRKLVSMYSGLLILGLAFWVDIRARFTADYAFWLYLFGTIAFWGGLSLMNSDSELSKFFYMCINLFMILIGATLVRRVLVVFGGLGLCGYLGHLAFSVFEDSWFFPISLTLIGLAVIFGGIQWQKHESRFSRKLQSYLPNAMRELIESKE